MQIRQNVSLSDYTTMGVGGPARYDLLAESEEDIPRGLLFAQERGLPLFVLGSGSNVVAPDEGYPGCVLRLGFDRIDWGSGDPPGEVTADAGVVWDTLVLQCVQRGWSGIECLSGIPGLVGASPVQNVGAYGQDVSQSIVRVRAYDREEGRFVVLPNAACEFGYRVSRFNTRERGRYIISSVTFALEPGGQPVLRYPELAVALSSSGRALTPLDVREVVLSLRRRKGLLQEPGDAEEHTAGSFFRNPVLTAEDFAGLRDRAEQMGKRVTAFPEPSSGGMKVPAAWLIEAAGFSKGYTLGRVGLSTHHANVIVNRGGASAAEVERLMQVIQDRVHARLGACLEPEPVLLGKVAADRPSPPRHEGTKGT